MAAPSLGNCSQAGHRAAVSLAPSKSKLDLGDHVKGRLVAKTLGGAYVLQDHLESLPNLVTAQSCVKDTEECYGHVE